MQAGTTAPRRIIGRTATVPHTSGLAGTSLRPCTGITIPAIATSLRRPAASAVRIAASVVQIALAFAALTETFAVRVVVPTVAFAVLIAVVFEVPTATLRRLRGVRAA